MEWKIIFDVDIAATKALYLPHIYSLLSLLLSYLLLGNILWSILNRYIQSHNDLQHGYGKAVKLLTFGLILIYMVTIFFYPLPQPYKNLSANMILIYFPEVMAYYWKKIIFMSFHTEESVLNSVAQIIRAPSVNISHPVVTLKKPIKHVFLIILESIRADALPLSESLANASRSTFFPNTTAANVTPFLNSLWMNSVRTAITASSSYTLKSLLSIYCGIHPLIANFLKEVKEENTLYDKCLPELLSETFRTANNQSAFRSAFFTAARGDFDHQRELFTKLKFDTINDGFEIYEKAGSLPDVGMFGPADSNISPLLWTWVDKILAEEKTSQLMMSLLVTGTHEPFDVPMDQPSEEYRYYVNDPRVNSYLNAMHLSDDFLKEIIDGFKTRKLYNETLFVLVSDHGYVFNDYGSETLGLVSTPLESAFTVPLMLHNPYLEAQQVNGQFTSMDILPTIMDIMLSSIKSTQNSTNQLLSVPNNQLKSILSQYEGTSILRMPIENQPIRYTFNLANPGNSHIIVKQYPRKLTYDVANDEVHLYHLAHDPLETIDLVALDSNNNAVYPSWLDVNSGEHLTHIWKERWISKTVSTSINSQILSQHRSILNNTDVQLNEMLDWADQTLELASLWAKLTEKRYRSGRKITNSE